jgi:hypothetical protein
LLLLGISLDDARLLRLMRHLSRYLTIVLVVGILLLKSHVLLVSFPPNGFKSWVTAMASLLRLRGQVIVSQLSFVVPGMERLQ